MANNAQTATENWRSKDFAWQAPAKLNLFLHITGRRANGYHELQSIFQFIDAHDYLYFDINEDGKISRESELTGVPEDEDLVIRAARILQQVSGTSKGVSIKVDKHLPMGGGLGGGSSDAATTFLALDRLWETRLGIDKLAELGVNLGADVPVFIRGHAAWAEGVGEILEPVELPEPWFVVIAPPVHVNTGQIFSSPQLTRDQHPITIRDFLSGVTGNVCQPLVEQMYPEVKAAIDWLNGYAPARMTGTGACVFAAFSDKKAAENCIAELPVDWQGLLAKGLNKTPIFEMFENTIS
ncbi:MAG: 4-(cytidine 5'-diphospho)-2-C-methyl-D-erythritol kinase [Gammaproteobacteria bacterium]|nr:4-(cytidine 5'-diphospho)-2-C-methyl-D-erythritol kinase [Gammaproteobacteria bacterium]